MPYRRTAIFSSPWLHWQQLDLQGPAPQWSEPYRVESPRLLLPLTRGFDLRTAAGPARHCEPGSALWLTRDEPYRLRRPHAGQRDMLLVVDADLGPTRRLPLSLADCAALARWAWRAQAGGIEHLALEEAIADRLAAWQQAPAERQTHRAVERARDYLASEPQRRDTLADIARAVHSTPFHLARQFRRHTGHSLHGFRTRQRLLAALQRLRAGDDDLTALALDLGFASHSHFSAAFRRAYGSTPRQMRTNLTAPPG